MVICVLFNVKLIGKFDVCLMYFFFAVIYYAYKELLSHTHPDQEDHKGSIAMASRINTFRRETELQKRSKLVDTWTPQRPYFHIGRLTAREMVLFVLTFLCLYRTFFSVIELGLNSRVVVVIYLFIFLGK